MWIKNGNGMNYINNARIKNLNWKKWSWYYRMVIINKVTKMISLSSQHKKRLLNINVKIKKINSIDFVWDHRYKTNNLVDTLLNK